MISQLEICQFSRSFISAVRIRISIDVLRQWNEYLRYQMLYSFGYLVYIYHTHTSQHLLPLPTFETKIANPSSVILLSMSRFNLIRLVFASLHVEQLQPQFKESSVYQHSDYHRYQQIPCVLPLLFHNNRYYRNYSLRTMSTQTSSHSAQDQPTINPAVPDDIPLSSCPPKARKRFAPLDENTPNLTNAPKLKGVVFDVDGTLWYIYFFYIYISL